MPSHNLYEVVPASGKGGSLFYLSVLCFIAALGGLLFGFDTAVISGTVDSLRAQFNLSSMMEGWVVSSALLGCIIGACFAGLLSDRFGRKKILILAAVFFLVSAVGSAIPPNVTILVYARLLGGLGVGIASMLSPLYISEYSPAHLRGRLVALYQLAIVLGVLLAYCSNALIAAYAQANCGTEAGGSMDWMFVRESWRGMFMAEALPATAFLLLLFCVPESPRWLAKQGDHGHAFEYLSRVLGENEAQKELNQLSELLQTEEARLSYLFRPGLRMALLAGILLPFFSQITGINVIIYYGTTIFQQAGFTGSSAFETQILIGLVNFMFTLFAIWKVDQLGRKPLLQAGAIGICLILGVLSVYYGNQKVSAALVAVLFCLHVACFAFSFGPVVWIVVAEIFPTKIRGRAMSVGTFMVWISCALVAQSFPYLRDHLGPAKVFLVYAILLLPSIFFIYFKVPETKGKTLEEIEKQWQQ
ncbi:MAG TPA: sugar porter family MFS transporter [Anaerohalosphaeraceae bacterium]|nr:sugar porter family MFS transporter [Anaerohalosphaeraceae bacterium]